MTIGLVVTTEGIPLGYEVFEGNRHDSQTVEEVVAKMESLYGKSDRNWAMDRGMVSKKNLAMLQSSGHRYIIGTPKNQLRAFEQQLLAKEWEHVHEGLEVQRCSSPNGDDEVFILCRNAQRAEKERAMHDRFRGRIEAGLTKIVRSCMTGRAKDRNKIERRLGRLLGSNTRAASMFEVVVSEQDGRATVAWR